MGYRDANLIFSDKQAVTASAISTNVYDTQSESRVNPLQNIGAGEPTYLIVDTVDAITDAGSDATLIVELVSADNAALTTNPVVHWSSGTLTFAQFNAARTRLAAVALPQHSDYKRYLGVRYTVAAGPFTAGSLTAYVAKDVENRRNYKSGFTV